MQDIVNVKIDYADFERRHPFPYRCIKRFCWNGKHMEFRGIVVLDVNNKFVGKVNTVSIACMIEEMSQELANKRKTRIVGETNVETTHIDSLEEEIPGGPPNSLIKEGTIGDCPICSSTTLGKEWIFWGKDLGCIQSECPNYKNNNTEKRKLALERNLNGEWLW